MVDCFGVPRYFFHLHNDIDLEDHEGEDLPDIAAARERATRDAQEMAALSVAQHSRLTLHHRVDVADENGAIIVTVTFGDVVEVQP